MEIIYRKEKNKNIDFIRTDIKSKDILSEEGKNKFVKLMAYFTKKFIEELEYENADEILNYAKNKGIELRNSFIVEYDNKKALVSLSYFAGKIKIKPYLDITCNSFLKSWTFESGHFSDVKIFYDDTYVCFSTIDTLKEHDVFLLWLIEHVQEAFNKDIDLPDLCDGYHLAIEKLIEFQELVPYIEKIINENKNIRIDKLTFNGKSIDNYISDRKIYKHFHTDASIFKLCFEFKKPFKQVEKYVNLHGID